MKKKIILVIIVVALVAVSASMLVACGGGDRLSTPHSFYILEQQGLITWVSELPEDAPRHDSVFVRRANASDFEFVAVSSTNALTITALNLAEGQNTVRIVSRHTAAENPRPDSLAADFDINITASIQESAAAPTVSFVPPANLPTWTPVWNMPPLTTSSRVYLQLQGEATFSYRTTVHEPTISRAALHPLLPTGTHNARVVAIGGAQTIRGTTLVTLTDSAPSTNFIIEQQQATHILATPSITIIGDNILITRDNYCGIIALSVRNAGETDFTEILRGDYSHISIVNDLDYSLLTRTSDIRVESLAYTRVINNVETQLLPSNPSFAQLDIAIEQMQTPHSFSIANGTRINWVADRLVESRVFFNNPSMGNHFEHILDTTDAGIAIEWLNLTPGENRLLVISRGIGLGLLGQELVYFEDSFEGIFIIDIANSVDHQLTAPTNFRFNDIGYELLWTEDSFGNTHPIIEFRAAGSTEFITLDKETFIGEVYISYFDLQQGTNTVRVTTRGGTLAVLNGAAIGKSGAEATQLFLVSHVNSQPATHDIVVDYIETIAHDKPSNFRFTGGGTAIQPLGITFDTSFGGEEVIVYIQRPGDSAPVRFMWYFYDGPRNPLDNLVISTLNLQEGENIITIASATGHKTFCPDTNTLTVYEQSPTATVVLVKDASGAVRIEGN